MTAAVVAAVFMLLVRIPHEIRLDRMARLTEKETRENAR